MRIFSKYCFFPTVNIFYQANDSTFSKMGQGEYLVGEEVWKTLKMYSKEHFG